MNSVHIIRIISNNNNAIHFANTFQQFVIEYLQCLTIFSLFHRSVQHLLYVSFKTEHFLVSQIASLPLSGVCQALTLTDQCVFCNAPSRTKCQYQGFVNFVRRLCWSSELENKNCEIGSMGTLKYAQK